MWCAPRSVAAAAVVVVVVVVVANNCCLLFATVSQVTRSVFQSHLSEEARSTDSKQTRERCWMVTEQNVSRVGNRGEIR